MSAHLVVATSAAALDIAYEPMLAKLTARMNLTSTPPVLTTAMRFVGPARRMGRKALMEWITPRALILYWERRMHETGARMSVASAWGAYRGDEVFVKLVHCRTESI